MSKQLTIQVDMVMGECRVETRRVAPDGVWSSKVQWYSRTQWDEELLDDEFMDQVVAEMLGFEDSRRVAVDPWGKPNWDQS